MTTALHRRLGRPAIERLFVMTQQMPDSGELAKPADEPANDPINHRHSAAFAAVVVGVVLVANLVLLAVAAKDRSWGALHIMLIEVPITNGILCVVSFGLTLLVKLCTRGTVELLIVASFVPIGAIFVDAALIMCMGLHGC
ncbi:MAG: hypothetical protein NTW19_16915 [Planctomycetota bacterium]|nr:hypothetical protein [Planctomycetota bacterium]